MRDVPGLAPLLDRAGLQAQQPPTYRFHGRRSPLGRERTPILDAAPGATVKDGVAKLRLYAPIDSWGGVWGVSALEFLETLDQLDDTVTEIRLHINSPGGEVFEALAILNNLRQHSARVVAVVDGIAASCASFIAVAADETIMAPNSQMMIHDAWGYCVGNAADMHETGDLLDRLSDNIAAIYASKTDTKTADWRDTMRGEAWYGADEAVDAGLADSVLDAEDDDSDSGEPAEAEFDLKGIGAKYASRAEAPAPEPVNTDPEPVADTPELAARRARMARLRHAENARHLTPA